ncbi:MAG TPA: hypothetical protein VNF47_00625 [Streptosporangiaceae bacterium]|nr:hypothetical protein [Streptosporangiaceae bacterium]
MTERERSCAPIDDGDLALLAAFACDHERGLFARHPDGAGRFAGRLLGRALCQGGALHYLDGRTGVKDLDVWSFYAEIPGGRPFPYRRHGNADFGRSKFGRHPGDDPGKYTGRRIDLMGRSVPEPVGTDPSDAIVRWLEAGRTESARWLAKKAVILIWPASRIGHVVWDGRVSRG